MPILEKFAAGMVLAGAAATIAVLAVGMAAMEGLGSAYTFLTRSARRWIGSR